MLSDRQIYTELAAMLKENPFFDCMNMYKGLPLVYEAVLQHVGEKSAKFKVVSPSSVCLEWEPQTTILEDQKTNTLTANVVDFDILSGVVELATFRYGGRHVGNRMIVRVEPRDVIPVDIKADAQTLMGKLADISLTGLGIRTSSLGDPELRIRDKVQVRFELTDEEMTLQGMVINITPEESGHRLAVYCGGSETKIPVSVARYIIRRREEIRQEIYEIYTQTIEKARIEREDYE